MFSWLLQLSNLHMQIKQIYPQNTKLVNISIIVACNCNAHGRTSVTCNGNGKCSCKSNFDGNKCDKCSPGYYNFPSCTGWREKFVCKAHNSQNFLFFQLATVTYREQTATVKQLLLLSHVKTNMYLAALFGHPHMDIVHTPMLTG